MVSPLGNSFVCGLRLGMAFQDGYLSARTLTAQSFLDCQKQGAAMKVAILALQNFGINLPIQLETACCLAPMASSFTAFCFPRLRNELLSRVCVYSSALSDAICAIAIGALILQRQYRCAAGLVTGMFIECAVRKLDALYVASEWPGAHREKIDLLVYFFACCARGGLDTGEALGEIGDTAQRAVVRGFCGLDQNSSWSFMATRLFHFRTSELLTPTARYAQLFFQACFCHTVIAELLQDNPWKSSLAVNSLALLCLAGRVSTWIIKKFPYRWDAVDSTGANALHAISRRAFGPDYAIGEMGRCVLSLVDVNQPDDAGFTALHYASMNGHLALVRQLLATPGIEISPAGPAPTHLTPLQCACNNGHIAIALILLNAGGDPYVESQAGVNALYCAIRGDGSLKLVEALLDNISPSADVRNWWRTLAHARKKDYKQVDKLLSPALLALAVGSQQFTMAHCAAWHGDCDLLDLLAANGADLNARDEKSATPLHHACARGHLAAVEHLLYAGVDVNAENLEGCSPFAVAVNVEAPNPRLLSMLMSKMDATTPANCQALFFLHFRMAIDEKGASRVVESPGVNINALYLGQPMLAWAVERKQYPFICLLLEREDIALTYRPNEKTEIDVLSYCRGKAEDPREWIEEVILALSPGARDRLAAPILRLADDELKNLHLYNPFFIAIALASDSGRKKVIEHLNDLICPSDQLYARIGQHDPFAWVAPLLESDEGFQETIKGLPASVALATLPFLSKLARQSLGDVFLDLVQQAKARYTQALEELPRLKEKIDSRELTASELAQQRGCLVADLGHLQDLEEMWLKIGLDSSIWSDALDAVKRYQHAIQGLTLACPEQTWEDEAAEGVDMGDFVARLFMSLGLEPTLQQMKEELGCEPAELQQCGFHSTKDCQLLGIDTTPFLHLQALKRSAELPAGWREEILPLLRQGIDWFSQLVGHLELKNLREEAKSQEKKLAQAVSELLEERLLVDKLLQIESLRLKTLLKSYMSQATKVPLVDGKALSEQYLKADWKSLWV